MNIKIDINALQKVVVEAIIGQVKNVRCPEHGQCARVVTKSNTQLTISGCCDKLMAKVIARFK
jgi:hypothetical protein